MTIDRLHQLFLKYPNACTDTRQIQGPCLFFALKGDNFDGNKFASQALRKGAMYAIIDDPGYQESDNTILVNDVLETLQKLASHHRQHCKAKIIGLTGSNGKTTTKELLFSVLSKKFNTVATQGNLNNHIGVPLTLLSIKEDSDIAIVEMGANHIHEIEFLSEMAQPDYGYITNFGKAHLEGFGSEEGVIKGKSELYQYLMHNKKHVFFNADDSIQVSKLDSYEAKTGFSTQNSDHSIIAFLGAHPFVILERTGIKIQSQLIGSYNFSNICASVLMGEYFGIPLKDIKEAIEYYIPENNRSQIIEREGHKIILDAYNANPTSMRAALENFEQMSGNHKIVFLGDMFELGNRADEEHQNTAELVEQMDFSDAFLIGENFSRTNTPLKKCKNFEELTEYLNQARLAPSQILIKGSRGMALERILPLL